MVVSHINPDFDGELYYTFYLLLVTYWNESERAGSYYV